MRTIIAGSRTISDYAVVEEAVAMSRFEPTEVVSGGARGVDTLGEMWALRHEIPFRRFLADWKRDGKKAGPLRNVLMAGYADALIAVWDGKSTGTRHMIEEAQRRRLKVYVHSPESAVPNSGSGETR